MAVDGGKQAASGQTKGSVAAQDRRVKLQHFLVMKAFNLRTDKQTVNQQFQCLKKTDDNQVNLDSCALGCERLCRPSM